MIFRRSLPLLVLAGTVALATATAGPALADRVSTPVAEFTGLDKITGRIVTFDVYIDETVQFGSLLITPRVCYMRTPDEPPQTSVFVEIDEVSTLAAGRQTTRIFERYMFAESPALSALEHPVYDIWLKSCKTSSDVEPPALR